MRDPAPISSAAIRPHNLADALKRMKATEEVRNDEFSYTGMVAAGLISVDWPSYSWQVDNTGKVVKVVGQDGQTRRQA